MTQNDKKYGLDLTRLGRCFTMLMCYLIHAVREIPRKAGQGGT